MGLKEPYAVSVGVPCINKKAVLEEFHRRLSECCRAVVRRIYEIVLVNDGSRDGTWTAIKALSEVDPHVVGIDLSRNHGHQLALTAVLSVCLANRILVIDAEWQPPPELLGELLKPMIARTDVVYGQSPSRAGVILVKTATASWFYRIFTNLGDGDNPTNLGDFRLISPQLVDHLHSMPVYPHLLRDMNRWIGFNQVSVLNARTDRQAYLLHLVLLFQHTSDWCFGNFRGMKRRFGQLGYCLFGAKQWCLPQHFLVHLSNNLVLFS